MNSFVYVPHSRSKGGGHDFQMFVQLATEKQPGGVCGNSYVTPPFDLWICVKDFLFTPALKFLVNLCEGFFTLIHASVEISS